MAWRVSTWLRVARLIQLLGALVGAALNGVLIVMIYTKRWDPNKTPLVSLEWMLCVLLLVSALILLVVHTGQRAKKKLYLSSTVVLDLVLVGILMAILSIQSNGGLPDNCKSFAAPFLQEANQYGKFPPPLPEVEQHCNLLRISFIIVCALFYTYIATIALSILSMINKEKAFGKRSNLDDLSREELAYLANKPDGPTTSPASASAIPLTTVRSYNDANRGPYPAGPSTHRQAPAPPSEGVTSPRASIMTHATPQSQDTGILPVLPVRKPVAIPALDTGSAGSSSSHSNTQALSSPSRSAHSATTLPSTAPTLETQIPHSPIQLVPGMASDDSAESQAAAALVTDGPRFFGREGGGAGFYEPGAGGSGNGTTASGRIPGLPPPYSPATPQYLQHREDERRRIEAGETGAKGG